MVSHYHNIWTRKNSFFKSDGCIFQENRLNLHYREANIPVRFVYL